MPKLLTTNTSSPDAPYVPISLAQHKHHKETQFHKLAIECRVAQVAVNKGVKVSQDGTVHSEFLAQVQSQPTVWQGVLHAQKSLPRDVSKSIEAMFSSAGKEKGLFESATYAGVPARKVFESTVTCTEKVITLPPSSREGADNGSSGAKRKCVPPVASPSGFSQIPRGADVERYKLSYLDWGTCDDEIDCNWDALTNGDID